MPPSHLLLALAVVFVWGTSFVVIRHGLTALPPFVFATLRFAVIASQLVATRPRASSAFSRS